MLQAPHPTCSQSKLSTEFRANSTASLRELKITAFAPHNYNLDTSLHILTPRILIDLHRLQPTNINSTPQTDPRLMNPHNTLVPQSLKRLVNRQIHHTPAPAHVLHHFQQQRSRRQITHSPPCFFYTLNAFQQTKIGPKISTGV